MNHACIYSLPAALLIFLALVCGPSTASTESEQGGSDEHQSGESGEHYEVAHHQGGHHKYFTAVFMDSNRVHNENESTLGIEVGMNLNRYWSVGVLLERENRQDKRRF